MDLGIAESVRWFWAEIAASVSASRGRSPPRAFMAITGVMRAVGRRGRDLKAQTGAGRLKAPRSIWRAPTIFRFSRGI